MRPLLGKPGRYASTGGRSRKGPFVLEAAMAKLSYAEQLKSPHWQRKRLEVLEEHGFACQKCDDTEVQLHVHHVVYERGRLAWEYSGDELQCLCKSCHEEAHLWRQQIDSAIKAIGLEAVASLAIGASRISVAPNAIADPDFWMAGKVASMWFKQLSRWGFDNELHKDV